jgi:hypothetical protein
LVRGYAFSMFDFEGLLPSPNGGFDRHLILLAGGVDAVPALKLLRGRLLEQLAALRHDVAELVADRLVHYPGHSTTILTPSSSNLSKWSCSRATACFT